MAKETKPLSENGTKAVTAVLAKQGDGKFWDGNCHAAALANLAEAYFAGKAKHAASGAEGKKGLYQELKGTDGGDWAYASNMKKRLIELKLIPANTVTGGDLI